MSAQTIACHKCQHNWSYEPPLARRAECPQCRGDARVCRNCRLFDTSAHHECREEQAEWVKEKDRSNFCSYFTPEARARGTGDLANTKAKLDQLFGGAKEQRAPTMPNVADELARFL